MQFQGVKGNKITLPNRDHWEFLTGDIEASKIYSVKKSLLAHQRKDPSSTVALFIYSEGGDPDLAVDFFWFVQMAKLNLITVGGGQISSAALLVLLAAEHRYLMPDTFLYFHEGKPGARKEYDVSESSGILGFYKKRVVTMHRIIANESVTSIKTLVSWEKSRKTLSALEARQHGLVTDVIADPRLAHASKRAQKAKSSGRRHLYAVK